ncbi:MAG: cell division protein FtsQ/DivIB [Lachnospiraceae bacterium]|nr:cell division protein FtsQ/DivIB [Lachnospiraceae bacterium]
MKKLSRYTKLSIVFIIVCGIAAFLVTFRLKNISLKNGTIYSDDEIKNRLFDNSRIDHNTYLFAWKVNHSSKYRYPFIEKIDVEVIDNSSVIIYAYGKAVIGCVEHMGQYMHFDREGVVVESDSKPLEGIPLIEGLEFENVVKGKKLEMGDSQLFDRLLSLIMRLKQKEIVVQNIVFGLRDDITLKIDGNEVLLGNDDDYDYRINNLGAVMEAVESNKGNGKYRYDMRNYNEKNQELSVRRLE